jgi:DUF218 domain
MTLRGGRWLIRVGVGLVVAGLLWAGLCYQVVENPALDQPTNVDAVVVLGPPSAARIAAALALLAGQRSQQLVVSVPSPARQPGLCRTPPAGVTVSCFDPDPRTTRGEAEQVRRLAAARHWSSIIVVTSKFHISRARLIVGRCFAGRLEMVSASEHISFAEWAYQYLYQSGGYVKAFLHPSC